MASQEHAQSQNAPAAVRLRRMLKSKVHRVTVTEANINYPGSLTLDRTLLHAADLYEFEAIDVVNVTNGERFTTYLIEGEEGECCLNGAAARLGVVGDIVILMSFDLVDEETAKASKPIIVHVDGHNAITSTVGSQ